MKLHLESAKLFEVDEAVEKAKGYAMRLLSSRAYTRKGISDKLVGREFSQRAIDETLEILERLNLIDDELFARRFVEERLRLRPSGRIVLARDLKRRGVPASVIDVVLDDVLEDVDTAAVARELMMRRANRYRGLGRDKALGRMYGFLGRRGFDSSVAREVAWEVWAAIEIEEGNDSEEIN